MREINVKKEDSSQRLDKYLLKYLNTAPKSFVYKMLRKKNIKLNGMKAGGNEILREGDLICLYLSEDTIKNFSQEKSVNFKAGSIDIIYEDIHVLMVNKPAGILSHPDGEEKDSMIDKILLYLYNTGIYDLSRESAFTPALCNRLDRNTTGIMVCGKTLCGVQQMNEIIRRKESVDKYYLAVVKGEVLKGGKLEGYHMKDHERNQVVIKEEFIADADFVRTEYEPIKTNGKFTLLQVKLITGKSHQIRAHLKFAGYPIVGDGKYGERLVNQWAKDTYNIEHQLLHAQRLEFKGVPGELKYLENKTFSADLPSAYKNLVEALF